MDFTTEFMSYTEFKNNILKNIRDYLPEEFSNASVSIQEICKTGGRKLDGLTISDPGASVAPVIYLNHHYAEYVASGNYSLSDSLNKIASQYMESRVPSNIDIEREIKAFDPKQIIIQLINKEINRDYLQDKLYEQMGEFAALYKLYVGKNSEGILTCPLTKDLFTNVFAYQGVKREELYQLALENTKRLFSPEFISMGDILQRLSTDDKSQQGISANNLMYILTNESCICGANMILNEDIVKKVEDTIGENFFVIPSSVHELILLSRDSQITAKETDKVIEQINKSDVAPEDRLGNHLYVFNSKERRLELASEFERREEKAQEKNTAKKPHRRM